MVTGLLTEGRAMRYKGVDEAKTGWRIGYERWTTFEAGLFPARITVTWEDRGRPWFVLDVDGVAVNAPVSAELAHTPATAQRRVGHRRPARAQESLVRVACMRRTTMSRKRWNSS
jgi:hypothetical protein